MSDLKITREVHAAVRETLKTEDVKDTATKHGLSARTVRRIKLGGRTYAGYKRILSDDHISLMAALYGGKNSSDEPIMLEEPGVNKPGFFHRLRKKVVRR